MLPEFFTRTLRILMLLGGMLFAQSASATFHLWVLSELYSNADGTVQYIELSTLDNDQEFVSGFAISASQGASTHTFTIPSDLPTGTAGHKFLVGTQGFAGLGIVAPDYIVPNGFLFLPNGSVDFAGVDSVTYGALPADGVHAIDRNGNSVVNAPTNFAGASGSIALPNQASISDARVFAYAEANYPSLFAGAAMAGQYLQYNYRYYQDSGNYLGIDTSGVIYILGPYTGGVITAVGPVEFFRSYITAWEATMGIVY